MQGSSHVHVPTKSPAGYLGQWNFPRKVEKSAVIVLNIPTRQVN